MTDWRQRWHYDSYPGYLRMQWRWLRVQVGWPLWRRVLMMPYYAIKFLFRPRYPDAADPHTTGETIGQRR